MREDDILREAEEIDKEIDDLDQSSKKFYKAIIGIFLIALLVLMSIPYYSIKHNPEPKQVGLIESNWEFNYTSKRLDTLNSVYDIEISNIIRNVAVQISSDACKDSDVCYAKALFYYVRDNINYISDPSYEYIQSPEETLLGAGDCEDKTILLGFLLKSIGIESRIVVVPGHAYLEAKVPDAPNRYKDDYGWITLDTTCSYCEFGEAPRYGYGEVLNYYYV